MAADALSAAAGESVTLEDMEAEAEAWERMQGSFGGMGEEPLYRGAYNNGTGGAVEAAGPVPEHPAGIAGSDSVQAARPSASPQLSSRHLAAALAHVKARTATEVGAPQVGGQAGCGEVEVHTF